jgi:hypothetical protein
MNYIITDNAKEISKELFRLGSPTNKENSLFSTITHKDGRTALSFDLDEDILIHPYFNVIKLIELTNYTIEQQVELSNYFENIKIDEVGQEPKDGFYLGRFPFKNIVLGYTEIKDKDFMIVNGWISEQLT